MVEVPQLLHPIDPHHHRAVDARELGQIESSLEPLQTPQSLSYVRFELAAAGDVGAMVVHSFGMSPSRAVPDTSSEASADRP